MDEAAPGGTPGAPGHWEKVSSFGLPVGMQGGIPSAQSGTSAHGRLPARAAPVSPGTMSHLGGGCWGCRIPSGPWLNFCPSDGG